MYLNSININNNFLYIKSFIASTNFGKRNNSDTKDRFSHSKKEYDWNYLIEKIKEGRINGKTDEEICLALNINEYTFNKCKEIGNIPKKKPQIITPELKEKIIKLKEEGKDITEIAQILNLPKNVVRYAITTPDAQPRSVITEELIEQIREARNRNESRKDTCARLKISQSIYTKCLNRGNMPKRIEPYLTDELKEKIKELRKEGKKNVEIAKILGIPLDGVKRVITSSPNIQRRLTYTYFITDELIEQVKEARDKGELAKDTCKRLKIPIHVYDNCVKKGNLPKRKESIITPAKKALILHMKNQGKTYSEIAKALNVSIGVVSNTITRSFKNTDKNNNEQDKLIIIEFAKQGLTVPQIVKETGLGKKKIRSILSKNNIKPVSVRENISKESIEKVIELVKQGFTVPEIAQEMGWNIKKLENVLFRNKIKPVHVKTKISHENQKRILELFNQGLTVSEIAQKIGWKEDTIKNILSKNNINPISEKTKTNHDNEKPVKENPDEAKQKEVLEKPNKNTVTVSPSAEIITKKAEPVSRDEQIRKTKAQIRFYENALKKARNSLDSSNPFISNTAKQNIEFFTKKINTLKEELNKLDPSQEKKQIPNKQTSQSAISSSKNGEEPFDNPDDYNLEKVLSSPYMKVLKFSDEIREKLYEIMKLPPVSYADIEDKIQALEKIRKEVFNMSLEYLEHPKEKSILRNLTEEIDKKINKTKSKIQKFEQNKTISAMQDIAWLKEEDFERKLRGHEKFLNISKNANCEMAEIEEANTNLKKAYPKECVIWIDVNYDVQNTNNPNEQKYTIHGKFYESKDGKKYGQFGTWKRFLIEFISDRKHVYKTFVDSLVENKYKIALF